MAGALIVGLIVGLFIGLRIGRWWGFNNLGNFERKERIRRAKIG